MRCDEIADHDIEVYILGHPQDEAIRSHLELCSTCAPRIADCRDYIAAMKEALRKFRED